MKKIYEINKYRKNVLNEFKYYVHIKIKLILQYTLQILFANIN